jgi:hypothetical protein
LGQRIVPRYCGIVGNEKLALWSVVPNEIPSTYIVPRMWQSVVAASMFMPIEQTVPHRALSDGRT